MGKGFKINEAGFREMERKLQRRMNKMNVTIPIEANMPSAPSPIRQQQNALLQAYYKLEAFDIFSTVLSAEAAERSGLDDAAADRALRLCQQDHLLETPTFNPAAHLTPRGRRYVESLEQPLPGASSTIINNFIGQSNNQIATGDNIVQNQTNAVVDIDRLRILLGLVNEFDATELSAAEQIDLADDIEVIEAQLASPSEVVPGYQRALRGMRTVMTGAAGSAIGGAVLEVITGLLAG